MCAGLSFMRERGERCLEVMKSRFVSHLEWSAAWDKTSVHMTTPTTPPPAYPRRCNPPNHYSPDFVGGKVRSLLRRVLVMTTGQSRCKHRPPPRAFIFCSSFWLAFLCLFGLENRFSRNERTRTRARYLSYKLHCFSRRRAAAGVALLPASPASHNTCQSLGTPHTKASRTAHQQRRIFTFIRYFV